MRAVLRKKDTTQNYVFLKHVERTSLFRTKNAIDEKCKRQEKPLASLHVPFCFYYLFVKRTVPKKDDCKIMGIGNLRV